MPVYHSDHCNLCLSVFISRPEKREKDEVKEVAEGYECGIKLEKFSEIKEGDILECYELVEEK